MYWMRRLVLSCLLRLLISRESLIFVVVLLFHRHTEASRPEVLRRLCHRPASLRPWVVCAPTRYELFLPFSLKTSTNSHTRMALVSSLATGFALGVVDANILQAWAVILCDKAVAI